MRRQAIIMNINKINQHKQHVRTMVTGLAIALGVTSSIPAHDIHFVLVLGVCIHNGL